MPPATRLPRLFLSVGLFGWLACSAQASSEPVFPARVSPKYARQSEGQARLHTCLDQYNANKASNANGGMSWIQKGGGYYSACSKRLRGG